MKKLGLLILLSNFMVVFGQNNESHIGIFYALPIGNFASTDYVNDGGYAEPGWGLIFDSWRTVNSWGNFGYISHSTYQWNKINTDQLAKDYSDALGLTVTATESRYSPFVTTLGPTYRLPISDDFEIGFAIAAGIMFNSTKGLTLDMYDESDNFLHSYQVNFDNNVAFAYYGQIQANYTIIEDLFKLGLYAGYTGAKQNIDIRIEGENESSSQDISYLTFGLKLILIAQK